MGEWSFLSELFDNLQSHSTMLGRFWLLLMLVFRILILGTVASDLFEDEQEEFVCNTLQPGCKQGCYDDTFPISQYRFWVFHIVLIATPSLVFLMYATHHRNKMKSSSKSSLSSSQEYRADFSLRRLYIINVTFRLFAEVGVLVGQWYLYGFKVKAYITCSRFPCPQIVDCFVSRPAEKTIFLCFYFSVGVISAISSLVELLYSSMKLYCRRQEPYFSQNLHNLKQAEEEENAKRKSMLDSTRSSVRLKRGSIRSSTSRNVSSIGNKPRNGKCVSSKTFMV